MENYPPTEPKPTRIVGWLLRLTVVTMCIGQAWWLAMVQETPLVSWLHSPRDVGGWNFSEVFALRAQMAIAALLIVTAAVTLFRTHAVLMLLVALLQFALAVAMWQMGGGFQIVSSWLPPDVARLLPFLTQAGRFVAPLALWLYDRPGREPHSAWEAVARWGTCFAFVGHGLEALWHSPQFADLILHTAYRWDTDVTETTAKGLLTIIGMVDLLLAVVLVSRRWRLVAIYAALWGVVTATSRVTAYGPEMGWYEALLRAAHFGLPAALAVYWWHRPITPSAPATESPIPP